MGISIKQNELKTKNNDLQRRLFTITAFMNAAQDL